MKVLATTFTLSICLLVYTGSLAQNTFDPDQLKSDLTSKKIKWNANRLKDLVTGDVVPNSCYFLTTGVSKIDWVQNNGQIIYSFLVTTSSLESSEDSGRLIRYNVELENLVGWIEVIKRGSEIVIQVDLKSSSGDLIRNEYLISDYELFPL